MSCANQKTELWREISIAPSYEVSNRGRVRRKGADTVLKQSTKVGGYKEVCLFNNSARIYSLVHRLVYSAFNGALIDGLHVCHIDGDPTNNAASNLLQGTAKINCLHRDAHGRTARGEKNGRAKITNEVAIQIKREIAASPRSLSGALRRGVAEQIAAKHGTSKRAVLKIRNQEAWAHV